MYLYHSIVCFSLNFYSPSFFSDIHECKRIWRTRSSVSRAGKIRITWRKKNYGKTKFPSMSTVVIFIEGEEYRLKSPVTIFTNNPIFKRMLSLYRILISSFNLHLFQQAMYLRTTMRLKPSAVVHKCPCHRKLLKLSLSLQKGLIKKVDNFSRKVWKFKVECSNNEDRYWVKFFFTKITANKEKKNASNQFTSCISFSYSG
jgi:hypothetical protein